MLQGTTFGVKTHDRCLSSTEVMAEYRVGLVLHDPRPLSAIVAEGKEAFAETWEAELWFDGVIERLRLLEAEA